MIASSNLVKKLGEEDCDKIPRVEIEENVSPGQALNHCEFTARAKLFTG